MRIRTTKGEELSPQEEASSLAKWQKLLVVNATLLTLFAVCAVVFFLGLRIHHTILLFSLGGLAAYALEPLVVGLQRLSGNRLSTTWSTLLVFVGLFLVFAGCVAWLGGQIAHQVQDVQKHSEDYRARAKTYAHTVDEQFLQPHGVTFSLEQAVTTPPPEVTSYAERFGQDALPIIEHSLSDVGESAVVLLIALYLLIFGTEMRKMANRRLSPELLKYAVPWEEDVNRILGGFVRGQLTLALITGAAAAIGLLLMGVHLWLILGLVTIVASLIPVFGPYLAAVPATLAALLSPTHLSPVVGAVAVLVLYAVINEVGSKILYPKLVGGALNLHEVVVLFVLFAGLEVGGIFGALLAAPIAALAMVTVVHLYRLWQELPEGSISLSPAPDPPAGER